MPERERRERLLEGALREHFDPNGADRLAERVLAAGASRRRAALAAAEWAALDQSAGARAPRRRWLAAAVLLLGLGVVVVTMFAATDPDDRGRHLAPPTQDPAGGPDPAAGRERVEVETVDALLDLMTTAERMVMVRSETIGARQVADANGSTDLLLTELWPETVEVGGAELAVWRQAIATSAEHRARWDGIDQLVTLYVLLPGDRFVRVGANLGEDPRFDAGFAGDPVVCDAALDGLLDAMHAELDRRHRFARGRVLDLDELRALPAAAPRVDCPRDVLDGRWEELFRFTQLRELRLRADADRPDLDERALRVLAALPHLVEFDLQADAITDEGLAALAALAGLERLVLRNAPISGAGFAALRGLPLQFVALYDGSPLAPEGLAELARVPTLRELQLVQVPLGDGAGLLDALPRFPSLRKLAIRDVDLRDRHLGRLLPTKLEEIVLVDAQVTCAGLLQLRDLPSLRRLEVVSRSIDDDGLADLAELPLRQLRLDNVAVTASGLAELQARAEFAVDCLPGRRLFGTDRVLAR